MGLWSELDTKYSAPPDLNPAKCTKTVIELISRISGSLSPLGPPVTIVYHLSPSPMLEVEELMRS